MPPKFKVKTSTQPSKTITRFLVTINTQQQFRDDIMLEKAKIWLENKVGTMLENFESYLDIYGVVDDKKRVNLHLSPQDISTHIFDPEAEMQIEVGSAKGRLHSHSVVSFSHTPTYNFRCNLKKIRAALPQGFHLDVKFIRDPQWNLERYVRKQLEENSSL